MLPSAIVSDGTDVVYICHECLELFLFKSDCDDHKKETGHRTIANLKIEARVKLDDRDIFLLVLP